MLVGEALTALEEVYVFASEDVWHPRGFPELEHARGNGDAEADFLSEGGERLEVIVVF